MGNWNSAEQDTSVLTLIYTNRIPDFKRQFLKITLLILRLKRTVWVEWLGCQKYPETEASVSKGQTADSNRSPLLWTANIHICA